MEDNIYSYYEPLLGYINKRVNNPFDAQDLLQDVFLKLSRSDVDQVNNLKSWLYTVTRNAIIDYYRKKRHEVAILEERFSEECQNEITAIDELSQCVIAFIDQLPKDYSMILRLHEIDGIPQKEIAEKLDMNYVTVRSRVQRGRKKLKEIFAQCCHVEKGGRGSIVSYSKKSNCC